MADGQKRSTRRREQVAPVEYHLLLLVTLALTEGVTAGSFDLQHLLGAAVLNTLLAIPFVALFVVLERRFGPQDRERAAWT